MVQRETKILVGSALLAVILILTLNGTPEGSIDIRTEELVYKNVTVANVQVFVANTSFPYMFETNETVHYIPVIVKNNRATPLTAAKIQKSDFSLVKNILRRVDFEEVVGITDYNETVYGEDGNIAFIVPKQRLDFREATGINLLPGESKMYLAKIYTEPWETTFYNLTVGGVQVDPTISACGTTISSAGLYTVTADLTCTGNGVTVNGNDIDIDFQGHFFDGDDGTADRGVLINDDKLNVTVRNGFIWDFGVGILGNNQNQTTIRNMSINSSAGTAPNGRGIRITCDTNTGYLHDILIENNTVFSNALDGIYVGLSSTGTPTCDGINIRNNVISANSNFGARLNRGTMNFTNNTVYNNGANDVEVDTPVGGPKLIANNTISDNSNDDYGIHVNGITAQVITVEGNVVHDHLYGIFFNGASGHIARNNTIYAGVGATPYGILSSQAGAGSNLITNNTIYNMTAGAGIRLSTSQTNSNATYNVIYGVADCISITTTGNRIIGNTCSNATDHGIQLESGANNNVLDSNVIFNTTSNAIGLVGSTGVNITNNRINLSAADGIQALTTSTSARITGNNVSNTGASNSCIGSNSNTLVISSNICHDVGDGITLNGGSTGNTVSSNILYNCGNRCLNLGTSGTGVQNSNFNSNEIYNSTGAAIFLQTATSTNNNFTGNFVYNTTFYINQSAATNAIFSNTTLGYNRTHGLVNWTGFTLNAQFVQSGVNILLNPDFVSVNDSAITPLNSTARIILRSPSCFYRQITKKTGFPITLADIRDTGTQTGDKASCLSLANNTANFTVSSFSGYALNLTKNITQLLPRIIFLPANRTQNNVSAFRQNETTGIWNVSTGVGASENISISASPAISGLTLKCAPYWNQSGIITVVPTPANIKALGPLESTMLWCWADFANTSGQGQLNFTVS